MIKLSISYNRLWKLLIDKKMSKADLRRAAEISPNTMTKLRRDEDVSMDVLKRICEYAVFAESTEIGVPSCQQFPNIWRRP